ncbi:mammalian cell entry protein [Mycobacterium ulcerans]|uniref:Mce associated membrane protein n=1 Tax=Mycobacterium ulcerans subsp. shinshuense TaxID=1124626 RepID=A0A1B4Y906_MYCUL|nr:mammalian cell entry protein [Mycobacterium ulcerans]ULL09116.1 mammalian cell entry protein [Mycobacterium liflandii]BAV43521.1 Mce associated membrane protein [Mycobacterium ulcerans subsp. shinshuense]
MEDQQPAAGDLTDAVSDGETEAAAAASDDEAQPDEAVQTPAAGAEPAEGAADDEATTDSVEDTGEASADSTDPDTDAEADGAKGKAAARPKRLTGRRLAAVGAAITALLFVGSAAFAGAAVQPYLADRAVVAIKLNVARTAANAITTLWTYNPENMDGLPDRAATYLSGDFGAQYRKFVDTIVAPNKQAKITNNTEVTGVAVESLDGPNAIAIVYTNTTTTSPLTKNIPSMKYLSYRLIMKRDRSRWFVTRMTTITSLDLTPRV